MKVIFLDIDGVMVTKGSTLVSSHVFPDFQQTCVACLNDLCRKTGAVIVISSTWRWAHPRSLDLIQFLKDQGVKGEVVGMTQKEDADIRGLEIADWLKGREDIESFVILDDDADMGELLPHLVQTNMETGLTPKHVARAIEMLEV